VFFNNRPTTLADLRPGMRVHIAYYTKDSATPDEVRASWRPLRPTVKAVDAARGTVTFETEGEHGITLDVTLPLSPDAAITLDYQPARAADIPPGQGSWLVLGSDKKTLVGVMSFSKAYDLTGTGFYDAARRRLVADVGPNTRIDLPVAGGAPVTLDGEPARIIDVKSELREGKRLLIRLSADGQSVAGVVAVTPDHLALPEPHKN
jgi:hypothetical protein